MSEWSDPRETLESCRGCLDRIKTLKDEERMLERVLRRGDNTGNATEELLIVRDILRQERILYPKRMEAVDMLLLPMGRGRARQALWQYYVLGMSNREIADAMACGVSWVKRLKAEAVEQLEQREVEEG